MIDDEDRMLYHEWIKVQLRKMDETPDQQTFYLGYDQYKKSLAERNSLDSDRIKR